MLNEMHLTQSRIGNFTSSEIVALMGKGKGEMFGVGAKTYIEECNMERKLGRSITSDVTARPISWGNLVERRAFDLLGIEYSLNSDETLVHPEIEYWAGSPDGFKFDEGKTVIDIKCPITLKSYCQLVEGLEIDAVRENHKDGDKYYWQLVSNAILSGSKYAELVVYVPYQSELNSIREMASNFDGDQNKIAWINWSEDSDLPYLVEGRDYKNINVIRFEVPEVDKQLLTERVKEAGKLLKKY